MKTLAQVCATKINAVVAKEVKLDAQFANGLLTRPVYAAKKQVLIEKAGSLRAKFYADRDAQKLQGV